VCHFPASICGLPTKSLGSTGAAKPVVAIGHFRVPAESPYMGESKSVKLYPEDLIESRQTYEPDSGVLATELRSRSGVTRITDALTFRVGAELTEEAPAGRGELLRSVRVLEGSVRLRIAIEPRGGASAAARRRDLPAVGRAVRGTARLDRCSGVVVQSRLDRLGRVHARVGCPADAVRARSARRIRRCARLWLHRRISRADTPRVGYSLTRKWVGVEARAARTKL
jgi:Nitrile reductase, 7-cyano-7-deazaguanine-reductase N-term